MYGYAGTLYSVYTHQYITTNAHCINVVIITYLPIYIYIYIRILTYVSESAIVYKLTIIYCTIKPYALVRRIIVMEKKN